MLSGNVKKFISKLTLNVVNWKFLKSLREFVMQLNKLVIRRQSQIVEFEVLFRLLITSSV